MMKIIVFGANGKVGQKVVQKLLDKHLQVRAFVHGHNSLPTHENLEIVTGDIHSTEQVWQAIQGCTAVISTLGSWGTKTKDIQVSAMNNIIPAMKEHKVRRIVSITGAGVFDEDDTPHLIDRLNRVALLTFARKVFRDGEDHLALLRQSKLDWTVLRSPIMKETDKPGYFVLNRAFPKPWETIVRDDVATALVELVDSKNWHQAAPFIHKSL